MAINNIVDESFIINQKKLKQFGDRCSNVKIGIMGGTFDPIHYAHLATAEFIRDNYKLDKILFIPSGNPPHKSYADVTTPLDRLKMTALAIEGRKNMEISSIEIDREGTTYTVDTIIELKRMLGDNVNFKFITGADAIHYITTWKNYKKLLEICDFIAVTRPGFNKKILLEEISFMEQNFKSRVEFIEIRPVDISSSQGSLLFVIILFSSGNI